MNIKELAYELYKIQWKKEQITPEMEADALKNYFEEAEESEEYTFEDYLWDCGYASGTLYVCFDEFLGAEYLDKEYMKELLSNEKLYEEYLIDLEQEERLQVPESFMRYEKLVIDVVDRDFLDFTNEEYEGNVILCATDELVHLTNEIRKKQGNEDLVGVDFDNDVYYNFYLMFNTLKKEISIQAVCNHGEKDDEVWYKLPMTQEEERNVMLILLSCFAKELYNS